MGVDVLREVALNSERDLHRVLHKLGKHAPDSAKVYQSVLLACKGFLNCKRFFVPREDSSSPLTLLVPEDKEQDGPVTCVALFTSSERATELYDVLSRTNVLNFNEGLIFCGVPSDLCNTVQKACEARGGQFRTNAECTLMTLAPQIALQFVLDIPDHVYLAPLKKYHARTVHSNWLLRNLEKYDVIERQIAQLPSVGLFLRKTGELISWILHTDMGCMGVMYTKKAYRRSGFGELVAKALAKHLATLGLTPLVFIDDYNKPSLRCFQKLGFQRVHKANWLSYAPPHLTQIVEDLAETTHTPIDECDDDDDLE